MDISMGSVILSAVLSLIIGFVLEFAVLGVDYSRSEKTQFEDDEYVYYVKAVPKSYVAQKEKSIKTISSDEDRTPEEEPVDDAIPVERVNEENFDIEMQLEESLKDL